ncbi:hypothetical protein ACRWZB_22885 [Escherichia coli]
MMNPVPWLQMTNMISYQGLVRTFLNHLRFSADGRKIFVMAKNGLIQLDRTRSLDPQAIIRHPQYGNVACIPEP